MKKIVTSQKPQNVSFAFNLSPPEKMVVIR